jgi:ATP-dependent Clp protease ATP-binding subunit ClpA
VNRMFSVELGYTLEAAFREAVQRRHAYFCVEHVLFALLFDHKIIEVIEACGGDVDALRQSLESFFTEQIETMPPIRPVKKGEQESEPLHTAAVQRVLQRALLQTRSSQREAVEGPDVLIALYGEEESHAVHALTQQGITKLDLLNFISHGVRKVPEGAGSSSAEPVGGDDEESGDTPRGKLLPRFAENLTEQARAGALDPVVGRDRELDRAVKILARRQKNNPLFIGEPGVGKTALANGLALRIVDGRVPELLKGSELYSLQVGSLVAGTKFRGEFEERLRRIVEELVAIPKAILFIDEIHQVVGAGATGNGSMDAANLLKPALSAGKFRCVGSTTHEDYKKSFEKDRALSRRFSTIDVVEPTVEETIQILQGLKARFEEHHKVLYSEKALRSAVELAAKHINDRALPDKAIDVVDEAGAANSLLPEGERKAEIAESDIELVVSAIARVPVKTAASNDDDQLQNLEARLQKRVFSQDPAIRAVVRAMKRSRANLRQEQKPVGCFLFAGPTGVGKTELAKALAKELGVSFLRFDMTEYMEKHAVARLIGAPPGYVGYEEGGQLTDQVRRTPYAVLLLDEIEKAHEDIYNILLQVMDDALLTDSHGKKADFRNIILIMTTNAGSERSASIGFGQQQSDSNREQAIKKLFRPEFRNRLDEVVYFTPLPRTIIHSIVDKFVRDIERQLKERNISFELDSAAREWLAERGFDPQLGARPMARVIQREISDALVDEILFGKLRKGGKVRITAPTTEKLEFELEPAIPTA